MLHQEIKSMTERQRSRSSMLIIFTIYWHIKQSLHKIWFISLYFVIFCTSFNSLFVNSKASSFEIIISVSIICMSYCFKLSQFIIKFNFFCDFVPYVLFVWQLKVFTQYFFTNNYLQVSLKLTLSKIINYFFQGLSSENKIIK